MSKDLKYIDDLVKKSLNDLTIEFPIGSWEMLEKNIPKKGFFRLDISSFNIYYLSMIAVASITIIVSLNFNKAEKLIPIKNQIANTKINDKQEIEDEINDENINDAKKINTDKNDTKESSNSFNIKNINATNNTLPKEENAIKQENTTQDLVSALNSSKPNIKNNQKENIVKEHSNKDNYLQLENINQSNNTKKGSTFFIKENKKDIQTKTIISTENSNNQSEVKVNELNNNINLTQKTEAPIIEKIEGKSVVVIENQQQQAYPDTVGQNAKGENIIIETTHWSIDLYAAELYNNPITTSNFSQNDATASLIKKSQSPSYSSSLGGNFNYSFKNWMIQLGVSATQIGEKNTFENKTLMIDSLISGYDQVPYSYYDVDTIWFYNLDSLLIGVLDSLPIYDSTLETGYNNIPIWDIDSNNITKKYTVQNKYTYLEIPLIFGYEINRNKFSYTLRAGLITGIFLNAKGSTISFDDSKTVTSLNKETPFLKTNFTLLFGCGLNYKLTENYSLISEFMYRKSLNSLFDNSYPISQKYNTIGLKLGVRYTF